MAALRSIGLALAAFSSLAPTHLPAQQPASQAPAPATAVLPPVTVTAQKRTELAEDVPIAMTVLGEEALDLAHVRTLDEIGSLAPNYDMLLGPLYPAISIRGVGSGGRNIGFDTRVGVYLDGIYIGQAQALGQPLFDIDQIEILRGPQGFLFGRNTVAGAVNITTRPPTRIPATTLRAGLGNHDAREIYATTNGPLGEIAAGKLAVAYEKRDGWATNVFDGDDLDDLDRVTARGQLRFEPTRDLSIDVYADYSRTRQKLLAGEAETGFFGTPIPGGPLPSRQVDVNTTPRSDADLRGLSVTVDYAFANGHRFTSITGLRNTDYLRINDTDWSRDDLIRIEHADDFRHVSQELRIASPDRGRWRYVVGLYLLGERAVTDRTAIVGNDTAAVVPVLLPGGEILNVPFGVAFAVNPGDEVAIDARVKTDAQALFGAVDVDVVPGFTLNLGARYTHERKQLVYDQAGGIFGLATLVDFRDRQSEGKLTPSAGFTWAVTPDANVYAKYATGFKSGGWNVDYLNVAQVESGLRFDAETVESYEVGIKGSAFGGRVQYDAAAFESRFKDYQEFRFVTVGATTVLQLANASRVRSRGVEASTRVRVSPNLVVGANFGYAEATYVSFPNGGGPGVDLKGQRVNYSPKSTSSVTLEVRQPVPGGNLDAYVEYGYRGSSVSGGGLADVSSRSLVNLRLTYSPPDARWSLSAWSRNLLDNDYIYLRARDFFGHEIVARGPPRTFGVEATYRF